MRGADGEVSLVYSPVLTTVAATSVVACGGGKNSNSVVAMNAKVSQGFGFVDAAGTLKVEVTVSFDGNVASWNSPQLTNITAAKLLASGSEDTPKAVSVDAGDFLVNVFKLKVVAGTGADRTFTRSEAELIAMSVKTWSPTIAKVGTTDYAISGGTAVVQFKKGTEQLGADYSLNILGKPTVGIIASILPSASEITLSNFNLTNFKIGESKNSFSIGLQLVVKISITNVPFVKTKSIVNLINQGDSIVKIAEVNVKRDKLAAQDNIKIQISIGTITFATKYTLTVVA